jgi:Reeler domain
VPPPPSIGTNTEPLIPYRFRVAVRIVPRTPGSRSQFTGFILQGRTAQGGRTGTFSQPASNVGKFQEALGVPQGAGQCRNPKEDSVTHRSASRKSSIEVLWRPSSDAGPINFR